MRSPSNPIAEELRAWAADPTASEPVQDWDLLLEHLPYEDIYLELASSKTCPKADYFLALLYLMVGDAVRTEYQSRSKEALDDLLHRAERNFPAFVIKTWIQRSRELMAQPQTFDYKNWCAGGWVYRTG